MSILLRALVALFLFVPDVTLVAAAAGGCESPAATAAHFQAHMPSARVVYIKGPKAQRMIEAFNAFPPPTAYDADELVMVYPPAGASVFLVLYKDGCATKKGPIARFLARMLMREGKHERPATDA